jgi:hypothetical protein
MTDAQRAEFAVNVWLETNTIEEALNRHSCSFEQNSLFQGMSVAFSGKIEANTSTGREYLFK